MNGKKLKNLWFIFFVAITFQSSVVFCADLQEKQYVPNEVLVKFHDGVAESQKELVRTKLNAMLVKVIKSINVEYWKLPKDLSTQEALNLLENDPLVEHAEPNSLSKPHALPNDPFFNRLWFLQNNGQNVNGVVGIPGADIKATKAWDIETGDKNIVIAVIDSGVAFDHPDLINNIWTNTNEIPNNGLDDDGNGYSDDINGWDFVNNDANPSDYSSDLQGDGHGTHVAGTIAAQGNNGVGLSGVMWDAQIMALQVFDLFQASTFNEKVIQKINILSAIEYAMDNGANIINLSLGGKGYSQFEYDLLSNANSKGVLIIAASGNDNNNNDLSPTYPASYDLPNIISVAATDQNDLLTSYSNYGLISVDVAAPGGDFVSPNILSTTPPEREILFYDDFESGGNKWITGGGSSISVGGMELYKPWEIAFSPLFGSNVAMDSVGNYYNFETSYMQTASPINISNCRGLHFEFLINYALENGFDFLTFDPSFDGINYIPGAPSFTGFSNGIQHHLEWAGSEFNLDQFYLRIKLVANNNTNFDGVYIDDLYLTGIPWEFDGSEYNYKSGTSMAAPVVAGVAGLVWSHYPDLTHLQVKDIILNSVDELPSLNGKVASGGRVNAYKALLPNPNDIDNDGDGFTENQSDCDDNNNTKYPGAIEICGDGIDQDCNGADLACVNQQPTANAGSDQSVKPGATVVLDGTGSSDPDGTIAGYAWTQTDATGISVTLSSASAAKPTFEAPAVDSTTTFVFSLMVTDNKESSSTADTVNITITKSSGGGGGGGCFIDTCY